MEQAPPPPPPPATMTRSARTQLSVAAQGPVRTSEAPPPPPPSPLVSAPALPTVISKTSPVVTLTVAVALPPGDPEPLLLPPPPCPPLVSKVICVHPGRTVKRYVPGVLYVGVVLLTVW